MIGAALEILEDIAEVQKLLGPVSRTNKFKKKTVRDETQEFHIDELKDREGSAPEAHIPVLSCWKRS